MIAACLLAASLWAPVSAATAQEPAQEPAQQSAEQPAQQPVAAPKVAVEAADPQAAGPQKTPEERARIEQELAQRRERMATLFEGALSDSFNGEDFSETPGYWHLLESLYAYPREEVSKRARADFDYDACMAEPDLWRGEFVKIRGLLISGEAVRLRQPIRDHEDVWRVLIAEADGSEGVWCDMLDRPPDTLEDRRSVVDVEGLVYRTVGYENRAGAMKLAPYLLARSLVHVDTDKVAKTSVAEPFVALLIAAAVVFVVSRVLLAMRGRAKTPRVPSKPPGFHELFQRSAANARRGPNDAPKQ